MKLIIMGALCLYGTSLMHSYAQTPGDNPYKSRYQTTAHWTDELRWDNVVNVSDVDGLVKRQNTLDSSRLHTAMQNLSNDGGGVLYFPKGTYKVNFRIFIPDGVVLRGETPAVADAHSEDYRPPSKLEFPRLKSEQIEKGISGQVLKGITGSGQGVKNFGLVNLDINRGSIEFYPSGYEETPTLQGVTMRPKYLQDNAILMGLRLNNSVTFSHEVPAKNQLKAGFEWLRHPNPYVGSINLTVKNNCAIVNNRINDEVTDNFYLPHYYTDLQEHFGKDEVLFSYLDHPVISLNQFKVDVNWNGQTESKDNPQYTVHLHTHEQGDFQLFQPNKDTEPHLFPGGELELKDNVFVLNNRHYPLMSQAKNGIVWDNNNVSVTDELHYVNRPGTQSEYNYVSDETDQMFSKHFRPLEGGDTLYYRYMQPKVKKNEKYPLILYLHPEDQAANDNRSQLLQVIPYLTRDDIRAEYPAFILAPQDNNRHISWNAYDLGITSDRVLETMDVIDSLVASNKNIDSSRLYLVGLSNGSTAVFKIALEYPQKFAAVLALDGVELNLAKEDFTPSVHTPFWTAYPEDLRELSLFIKSRRSAMIVRELGGEAVNKMYPGARRPILLNHIYNDPTVLPWLFSKRKTSATN